ncbi:MAG: CSLREA domain-containing protein [Rhodanobacteraceae bacterium]|nr:CSLREA domain-containing protein [Rhodanobacteraceae bacterium]
MTRAATARLSSSRRSRSISPLPASVFQAFNHTISFPGIDASTLVSISATATRLDGSATRATSELSATRAIVAVGPNVFTVTKTADTNDGSCNADCSLREAIVAANGAANAGGLADLIRFNIPGAGPHLLQPASVLPAIDQATIIDGYSQPGSSVNTAADDSHNAQLQIALNLSAGRLLIASGASGSAIRGLNLGGNNAQFLLQVDAANFDRRQLGGVLPARPSPRRSRSVVPPPLVGGPLPADRNVFLPTQFGLQLTGGATVRNNLFGILPGGSTAPNPAITHIFCLGPSTATLEVRDNAFRAGRGIECGLPRLYAHTNRFLGEAALLDVGSRHRVVANQVVCTSSTALTVSSTAVESRFADNVLIDCPRAINIGAPFNDPLDADSGPNGQQNHPLLGSATRSGDSVLVNGTLNSNPAPNSASASAPSRRP